MKASWLGAALVGLWLSVPSAAQTVPQLLQKGIDVGLPAKEFRLLAYLAARPGRALARNDILNAVWGNSIMVTPRSVDRCVTTLRAKIEADPRKPGIIQTIRDVGYRFEPAPADV